MVALVAGCATSAGDTVVPAASPTRTEAAQQPAAPPPTADVAASTLAEMRLQAQIDRLFDEYQKRPRKKFIGARASDERFARYEEAWRAKIERIGTLNYPEEARGRLYGSVQLTVSIRPDGSVESVDIERSSGYQVLDQAALRIVRLASPFAAFPPEISRDTDLLVITRTWHFGRGDQVAAGETDNAGRPDGTREWAQTVRAKVRDNLVVPAGTPPDIEASFSIVQLPTGEVLSVKMLSSSGFKPYDEAAYAAILTSSPLPKAAPGLFQRELVLKFRP